MIIYEVKPDCVINIEFIQIIKRVHNTDLWDLIMADGSEHTIGYFDSYKEVIDEIKKKSIRV